MTMKTGLCGARREGAGGALVVAFAYDGDGQRVAETSADGTERRFLVDLNNSTGYAQVVEEHIVGDGLAMVYAYGLDLIAQHRVAEGDGAGGGALETHYFGHDALGTTRLLTDAAGAVTDRFFYDAYGLLLRQEGTTETRYLYTGEQYTASLGMYYLRARYMAPEMGRFWTRDKWESFKSVCNSGNTDANQFLYTRGNPVSWIDPSGYITMKQLLISTAIVGVVAAVAYSYYTGLLVHQISTLWTVRISPRLLRWSKHQTLS